jgi:hypothetical protein
MTGGLADVRGYGYGVYLVYHDDPFQAYKTPWPGTTDPSPDPVVIVRKVSFTAGVPLVSPSADQLVVVPRLEIRTHSIGMIALPVCVPVNPLFHDP